MSARPTPDSGSPSPLSPLLPQVHPPRPRSLASMSSTSQVNTKEILAETLDQIHSTVSQSGALITFNEYTSPPSSSSGAEDRGVASDLQGGFSGLYSRFRASVGNVKDIVTLSTEAEGTDDFSTESPKLALPSPTSSRLIPNATKSSNPSVHTVAEEKAVSGSRHSSRGAISGEASAQDGSRRSRPSNLSSGNTVVNSKAPTGSTGPLRSPANLAAATGSVASPAVVEVNVNAIQDSILSKEPVVKDISSRDSMSLATPALTSPAEAKLSLTVGQQRPASLQSRPMELPEARVPSLTTLEPIVSIKTPGDVDNELAGHHKPVESENPQDARLVTLQTTKASHSQSSFLGLAVDAEAEKIGTGLERNGNVKETPSIMTDPGTPQPPVTGGLAPSETEKGLLSATSAEIQYQHVQLPNLKSSRPRPHSRSGNPDMNLTRTSSETTAASLIHASRHKPRLGETHSGGHPRDLKTMNVVLSQARSKVLNREYWMRDENARDCFYCGDPFSTFRRKHHCSMRQFLRRYTLGFRFTNECLHRDLRSDI